MSIVTLTTDWGDRNHFSAMVKGRLYSAVPDVNVVDLSHSQDWDSRAIVSKIIRYGCFSFPAGTVHIIDFCEDLLLKSVGSSNYRPVPLLAECRGHFFLCCNRKLLEFSIDSECDHIVALPLPEGEISNTFLTYSLFCDVAAKLLKGANPLDLGTAADPLVRRDFLKAQYDGDIVLMRPDCIDKYGNVTFNLTYSDFESYRAGRAFRLEAKFRLGDTEKFPSITRISKYYDEVPQGNLLLTVSSLGYLQLALNHGSVTQYLGVDYSSVFKFVFLNR